MLLDASYIAKNISSDVEVNVFDSITSTNDFLKKNNDIGRISVCLAEQQTEGRGRLNRSWYSPYAKNIYFSCAYSFNKPMSQLSGLSLAVSLAVYRTLKGIGVDSKLGVKWPNDILYDNKKISGSLIEVDSTVAGINRAIIGIGINVNMQEDDAQISQAWTSVRNILGYSVDRNALCVSLINQLLEVLPSFQSNGLAPFVEEWMLADCLSKRNISINNLGKTVIGWVVGINAQGHLLLRVADGSVIGFSAGDCGSASACSDA